MKRILLLLLVVLVVIQFFRPEKNVSDNQTYALNTKYQVPDTVATLLHNACNDCHSNYTTYPWYAEIQPTAWWLANHIKEGKKHLNFSEFTSRPIWWQNHKLEETIEMVKEKEMPIPSYTWLGLHKGAKLTDAERQILIDWAQTQMDTLKAKYPADSLKMPKRKGPPPAEKG